MFIYKITNLITGKYYIGLDSGSEESMTRWNHHLYVAKTGKFKGRSKLYNSMIKHGIENFQCEIIDRANTTEELKQKEIFWIYKLDTIANGYNIMQGGNGWGKIDELPDDEREIRKEYLRRGSLKANEVRWSKVSEDERKKIIETMKKGWEGKDRSKCVRDNWAALTDEERARKSRGVKAMWASMTKEEKAIRCSTHRNGNPRSYKVTDPNGNTSIITGQLKQFCKDSGMSMYYVKRLIKGELHEHLGWKIQCIGYKKDMREYARHNELQN